MFGMSKNKERLEKERNELNNKHLHNMALELHNTCLELGCKNCQYDNYDGVGHCRLSAFDEHNVEYRPINWGWIKYERRREND